MTFISTIVMSLVFFSLNCMTEKKSHSLYNECIKNFKVNIHSKSEYDYRYKVFVKNLKSIESEKNIRHYLNKVPKGLIKKPKNTTSAGQDKPKKNPKDGKKKPNSSLELGINKFFFLTEDEFEYFYLLRRGTFFQDSIPETTKSKGTESAKKSNKKAKVQRPLRNPLIRTSKEPLYYEKVVKKTNNKGCANRRTKKKRIRRTDNKRIRQKQAKNIRRTNNKGIL